MKFLIVGLGNIGEEYEGTRHNIGFEILDAFAKASNIFFTPDKYGEVATAKHKGRTIVLLKPNTYMNLSGKAVRYWLQKEKIDQQNLLVITDDLALPFGKIRIRAKGSDGGHNGIKNIIELLGNNEFPRLRFGISSAFDKGKQVNYVLGKWNGDEQQTLIQRVEICIDAMKDFAVLPCEKVMSAYNGK